MRLLQIYECFCDETRLRIIHLLIRGPLCVCHLQEILGQPQVKVSRHLAYLKMRGLVESTRHQHWVIYRLPEDRTPELEANLKCLQDCRQTEKIFKQDEIRLKALLSTAKAQDALRKDCCAPQSNQSTQTK